MGVYKREYLDERGNPVWYYIFPHNGRRYRQSGFTTKRQAEMAETKRKNEVMFEGKGALSSKCKTFPDLFEKYLEYRSGHTSQNTQQGEQSRKNSLMAFFGKMKIYAITARHIQQYVQMRLDDGKATRTINLELLVLRSMFRFAVDYGYLHANPSVVVKDLKRTDEEKKCARDKLDRLASCDQLANFLGAALKTSTGYQLYAWMMLMAYTGPRPSEAFRLEWSDVNFAEDSVSYWSRKTADSNGDEKRKVPIQPELKKVLLNWKKMWTDKFGNSPRHNRVFFVPRQPEKPSVSFDKCWKQAITATGLKDFSPHSFRHYFISRALMSGVDILTVSRWVGHSSTTMIAKVYGHLVPEFHKAEMAKVKIV